jgi:hypothetical protein
VQAAGHVILAWGPKEPTLAAFRDSRFRYVHDMPGELPRLLVDADGRLWGAKTVSCALTCTVWTGWIWSCRVLDFSRYTGERERVSACDASPMCSVRPKADN